MQEAKTGRGSDSNYLIKQLIIIQPSYGFYNGVGWALAHSRQAKKEIVCLTY